MNGSGNAGTQHRRRVVVTGASGNVGTALLLQLGERFRLHGVSRRPPPAEPPYSWAEWSTLDIGRVGADAELTDIFRGADAVVHLAWQIQPSRDREQMRSTNVTGTRAVVDAAIRAGVPHLVHQSSVGAYSPGPAGKVAEDWPTDGVPTSSYGVDKAAAERIVARADAALALTVLRPGLIFQDAAASEVLRYFGGPLVPHRLVGRRLARLVPLPAELKFQVVHADDVARALQLVLDTHATGAFNVAAEPVIDRDVWRRAFGGVGPPLSTAVLRSAAALTWRARLQPTEPGWVDLARRTPLLDTRRITELGWSPVHTADDVLARFIDAVGRGAGRPGPLLHRAASRKRDALGAG